MWAMLGKQLLKSGVKKVAKDKLLNRKKKRPQKRTSGKEMSEGIMNNEEQKKGGALAVRPSTGLVPTAGDLAPVSTTVGESDIVIIKKQVIQVRDILKDTRTAKQAERDNQRKARQTDKRKEREDKLEKPPVKPKEAKSGMKMPNLGLGIGNFLTWLIAGLIFNKLKDLMPALKKIFNVLKPIANFIGGVLQKTLGFVTGFIDLAYTGVEKLREGMVAIGGEGGGELFDKFGRLFTQVMNGALIAAIVAATLGNRNRWRKPKGPKSKLRKGIERWFKKTTVGRFVRNQKAGLLRGVRRFSKTTVGRTLNALRPKNVSKFIMEGGIDKTIKNVGGNLLERAKNIELPKTKPGGGGGLFSWLGKKGTQAKNLAIRGKDLAIKGKDWAIKKGTQGIKFLAAIPGNVIDAVKNIKWGELPGVKQFKSAYNSVTGPMFQWIDDVGKNLSPGKMIQGLLDQAQPTIDDLLAKNPALKTLGSKIDPKKFVPWMAENFQKFRTQAEPIATAVKGNKALKSVSNFLGPVDIIVDSMFALIDYSVGKESLVNAIVKALSSTLGFAAGSAAGASFGTTVTAAAAGTGVGAPLAAAIVPMIPYITFGMGMGGAFAGEFLGNKILEGIVKMAPGLADIDDPIAEELGFGPRKLMRDPFAPNPFKKEDETGTSKDTIVSSNGNTNAAEGLNGKTSYGSNGVVAVENNTTIIQPVEV